MKKWITFYLLILTSVNFSIDSLSKISFETLFNHKTWKSKKESIQQGLKEGKFLGDLFKGQTVIGLDFSTLDLSGKDFTDCKFVKVILQGADLTNTDFHNTHFDRCNLVGAIFPYPLNGSEKVFKVKSNDHYTLVKQYSDLMNEKEKKEEMGLNEEAADLDKQTKCLNHLFGALRLNLIWNDLTNFNLIDINFQNVVLEAAELQGARLSKDFKVPPYNEPKDLFNAFKEAMNKNTLEKRCYMMLLNGGVKILPDIKNKDLKDIHWDNIDLKYVNLQPDFRGIGRCALQGTDFERVNFRGTNLKRADLTDANLIDASFTNAFLIETKLQGARFSKDFKVPVYTYPDELFEKWYEANINNTPDKKYYNMLVANKFDMFHILFEKRLKSVLEKSQEEKLDLRGANLYKVNLSGIKLLGTDLENVILEESCLNDSVLKNINLKNAQLGISNFAGSKLEKVDFDLSSMNYTKFNKATLNSVSFKGANLESANFIDATLEDVDFFAADISRITLAENVKLPSSDSDQEYIKFYYKCPNPKAKALLKIILESRDHSL